MQARAIRSFYIASASQSSMERHVLRASDAATATAAAAAAAPIAEVETAAVV